MKWFKKKKPNPKTEPAVNPIHKYVERAHWDTLQDNFRLLKNDKPEVVIAVGLAYRDNISHPGEALLLFEAFFLANKPEHLGLRRELCDEFISGSLSGFDSVDRQYLLDVAAASMRLHFWDVSKNDEIHTVANVVPKTDNVNPLLTTLFRIENADKLREDDLIEWYTENIRRIANRSSNDFYKVILIAAERFKAGSATESNLLTLQQALSQKSVDAYAANFTITPEELAADSWAVLKKIGKIGALVSNELDRVKSNKHSKPAIIENRNPIKPQAREISISDSQIIGVSWSAKKNKNGATLEYARSGHGGGIAKAQMSAKEFELLKQGKGMHAVFFTKEEREKFFGSPESSA